LSLLKISKHKIRDKKELLDLIKEEVNVKEVKVDAEIKEDILLDLTMTDELKNQGRARELIRKIQQFKKELEVMPQHQVVVVFQGKKEAEDFIMENLELIEAETAVKIIPATEKDDLFKNQKEVKIEEVELTLFLKIV
jgi:isoleucyl-tRNA synthetase